VELRLVRKDCDLRDAFAKLPAKVRVKGYG
jgi:hypothetical protein